MQVYYLWQSKVLMYEITDFYGLLTGRIYFYRSNFTNQNRNQKPQYTSANEK